MSVIWIRAAVDTLCGGPCQFTLIARGEPMVEIRIKGLKAVQHRCQRCAGEAPPDLPPLVEPRRTKPMVHIRMGRNALPFDFKSAAAGERDPGQEG